MCFQIRLHYKIILHIRVYTHPSMHVHTHTHTYFSQTEKWKQIKIPILQWLSFKGSLKILFKGSSGNLPEQFLNYRPHF